MPQENSKILSIIIPVFNEINYVNKLFDQIKIYFDKEGSGLASLNNRRLDHIGIKFKKAEEVKLMQLNTIIKQELGDKYKVNFCKIDIEGHEFFVLKSIKNNFENYDIDNLTSYCKLARWCLTCFFLALKTPTRFKNGHVIYIFFVCWQI